MTAEIHDLKPDRFLRELSEGTGISEACKRAGLEHDELVKMLEDNPKFRHTVREVIVDHAEGTLRLEVGGLVSGIRKVADDAIALIMVRTEEAVIAIHEAKNND